MFNSINLSITDLDIHSPAPPPPGPQVMYGQPRMIMTQQQQMPPQHMVSQQPLPTSGRPGPPPSVLQAQRPPAPDVGSSEQQRRAYEHWLSTHNSKLEEEKAYYEKEIEGIRKSKKSLNAKQRALRKNNNELNEQDALELGRVSHQHGIIQKKLEQLRKGLRTHTNIINEYKQKHGYQSGIGGLLSPGAHLPLQPSNTPRVASPMTVSTPLGGQMMHSPVGSIPPPSPMHHSPMNDMMAVGGMRPQIVQDDNNPFSESYLLKEKKQHMQHQYASHPMQQMDQRMPMRMPMVPQQQQQGAGGYVNEESQQQQGYYNQQQPQQQSQMIANYQMRPQQPQQQRKFD